MVANFCFILIIVSLFVGIESFHFTKGPRLKRALFENKIIGEVRKSENLQNREIVSPEVVEKLLPEASRDWKTWLMEELTKDRSGGRFAEASKEEEPFLTPAAKARISAQTKLENQVKSFATAAAAFLAISTLGILSLYEKGILVLND